MATNWGGIASAIGSIGSGIMGLFGGSSSGKASARQYEYNKRLQQQAQEWNEYMYKHRYQWQSDDMEAAGINKLYGLGQAPAVTSGMNSVGLEDDQGNENARNRLKLDTAKAGVEALSQGIEMAARKAEINKTIQETKTEEQNTLLKQYEAQTQEYESLIKKKDLNNYEKKLKVQLEKDIAETKLALEQSRTEGTKREALRQEAATGRSTQKNIEMATKNLEETGAANRKIQNDTAEWLKKNPKVAKIVAAANGLSSVFGNMATIAGIGGAGVASGVAISNAKNNARKNTARRKLGK